MTLPRFIQIAATSTEMTSRYIALADDGTVWCYDSWGDQKGVYHRGWRKLDDTWPPVPTLEEEADKEMEDFLA